MDMQSYANHVVQQFADNVMLVLQDSGWKTKPYVTVGTHVGDRANPVDYYGTVNTSVLATTGTPLVGQSVELTRRWVVPAMYHNEPILSSDLNLTEQMHDPRSSLVQSVAHAFGRRYDDVVIDSIFAAATTGVSGTGSTSFSAGQQVAVNFQSAGNTGLTIAKLREARRLFRANQVDLERESMVCFITSEQEQNLLTEIEVVSKDFGSKFDISTGKLPPLFGIEFVLTERLDTDGSGYRRVPVFTRGNAIHFGEWNALDLTVERRVDLAGRPWQIYGTIKCGATRLDELRVVELKCAE